ncbi:SDR family oxidoreductase [Ralstonia sp. UNC404CL21Col]|uniref:SDR family oxidoreductase n=1 Tax=Ralstonia sp. UNC404CL21Col TaxID=1380362 RepID=UPI000484C635|nr:SDR family oxidoreductase [Ralstonia sp. UNC404CL21Col]
MSDTSLFILTGASRGLGAALAQALMQPGHRLICVARGDNAELRAQATAAGVMLDWHQVDLSDAHAAEAWMTKTLAALPAFANVTLVLNAGAVEPIGTIDTLRADTLLPHLQLNLAGPMALTAALLRGTAAWNAQRRVLAISSGAARRPIAGWAAYCTGKAGLDMFVRAINADGDASVRAVALAPGVIDTDMQRTIRGADFAGVQRFRDLHAHGELVSPQDAAARIAAYLVRPDFGATELDDLRNIA